MATPVAVAGLLEQSTGRSTTVAQPLDLLSSGDRGARRAVADAGQAIGTAVSWIVNILNPDSVVIGGELAAGVLGDRAEVLGAAALILAQSPLALTERVRG